MMSAISVRCFGEKNLSIIPKHRIKVSSKAKKSHSRLEWMVWSVLELLYQAAFYISHFFTIIPPPHTHTPVNCELLHLPSLSCFLHLLSALWVSLSLSFSQSLILSSYLFILTHTHKQTGQWSRCGWRSAPAKHNGVVTLLGMKPKHGREQSTAGLRAWRSSRGI